MWDLAEFEVCLCEFIWIYYVYLFNWMCPYIRPVQKPDLRSAVHKFGFNYKYQGNFSFPKAGTLTSVQPLR